MDSLSPTIKRGQRVTVTYTDPTDGDDARAIQDRHGNDAASFTLQANNSSRLVDPTLPGAPTGLAATANDAMQGDTSTQIDLAWTAPAAIEGVPAPTGYRIEWSPDGTSDWEELVEDTSTTDVAYSDAGLPPETTRHYRVFAINASGTGPPSNVDDATTEDFEPPTEPRTPLVHFDGVYISIRYDQPLDAADATEPLPSAFTVIADGIPITIGDVTVEVFVIGLGALSPTIKRGQVVTVTYTDPTDGDDARAIQDVHGNDAASYTVQADNDSDVDPILPGAPTGLTATANDAMQGDTSTQIDLAWVAPGEIGSGIKGYLIEVSPDGAEDSFTTLEASHDTMEDGEIVTAYADTGLPSETTRYYRVKAISAAGTTSATDVAHDTTADIVAPVLSYVAVVFDTMRIQFNEALDGAPGHTPPKSAFTVTADGFPTDFDTVSVSGPAAVLQGFSPTIKAGQTVTVTYTDANAGDDTAAIQDLAGNDAAGFTTGEDGVPAVVLGGPLDPPVAPDAPAGLTATAAGETRIDLAWSPPPYNGGSAVTGYLIEVSADGTDGSFTTLEANHDAREDGAIVTAYAHTGDLAPGTTRHYRVFAINAAGTGPASGVADDTTATAGAGTPDEPTELTATATGAMRGDTDTNIDLDWTKPAVIGNSPITGYLIEWSADGVSGWLALVENHAEMQGGEIVTGYSDTGLPSETERHYRVSAINDQGTGPASVVAHTASARIVPLAPTGLAATTPHATEEERTVRGIALAWRAPADTGTTDIGGYRIEWSADGMSGWQDLVEDTGSADAAHRDRGPGGTGFPAGTTRHYRVSAINDGGVGRASDAAHATIRPAPVRAGTNARGSQIAIEFGQALDGDAANAPAADRFAVSVKGAAVKIGDVVVAGPSGQVLLNGLSPLIRHGQVVTVSYTDLTAGDDTAGVVQLPSGLDAGSFEVEVHNYSTAQPSAPEKPAGLDAEAEDDAIALRWEPPVHDGGRAVTGYRIEVSADGTRFTTLEESHNETKEDGEIETAYMDAGLGPRTTRHYRVRATNEVDTGPASETAMATTAAGVPGAPTGLAATANDAMPGDASTHIDLAWTKPAEIADVAAPTGYRIEWSPDGASHWRDLVPNHAETEMQSGEIVTAYADVDLPSETTRYYRVSAINGEGRGPVSGVEHATSADIAAPAPVSASVAAAGTSLAIVFDEALDEEAASEPAPERFAVTAADGAAVTIVTIGSVAVSGTEVSLSLDADSPVIRAGQTVTVAYTDPTAGDDAAAVQDDDGNDAETFEGFAVVNGSGVAASVPGAPTGLGAEARGPDRIRLSWDTPADNGGRAVTGYRIDVSTDGVHFATLEAEHDVTVYEHMGVPTGVTRHYLVYAINAIGTGEASVGASAMTTTRVPGAPTGLAATANDDAMPGDTSTHIDLAWTKPAEIGESAITGYKIEWSADGNAPWIEREANHAEMENGGIVTAYSDTGLDSETTRYYRISAINGDGAGSPSNVDGATTGDIAGPEPQSASVTGSGTGIAIVFDEALDGDPANAPATDRFAVSVDGVPAAAGSVAVWSALKQVVLGGFSPAIRDGQAVTVTYTDLTDGDDATGVIQDDDGNDAEPFTLPRTLPREILVTNGATRPVSEPDAPESLMAESGQDRILLTWDPPADYGGSPITGYVVERSADVDPRVWRKLASNHEETAYEDVVEPEATRDKNTDVTRHYRVSATNAIGTGDPSDPVRGTIETGLADAPAGLKATAVGGTRIDLVWKEPADEGESLVTGYRIEWSEDGNAPWEALVEDTGSTDRSHSDTMELDSETTRHYRVAAINGQGTGPRSEPAHATTDDIVMPMPVSASVAASGAALTIVFDEALDAVAARLPAAARFAVAATDGACIGVGGVTVSGTGVTLALSLAGGVPAIKRGQTVTVGYTDPSAGDDAAAVQDDDGNDAATFASLAVANGSNVDPTAPARPTGLVAEAGGDTRIGLAWRAPCNTGGRAITGYRIERSADDGNGNSDGNWEELEDDGSTDVAYPDTGRDRGTRYHYRVSARNAPGAAGLGPVSDVADTATTMTGPGAPTELMATAIGTTIRLSWMKPADEGASAIRGYKIERSADDGSGNSDGNWEVLEADTGTTATAYDDEGLGHGETYHYRVSAFNSDSAGPVSNVADATIDIRGPVPQSASVAATGRTLTIAFDEALDAAVANLPAAARFAIAAPDGARFRIGAVAVSATDVTLTFTSGSAVIRTGQAVTVAYADPNAGDDARGVVQDDDGNDAAPFTLGPGLSVTVNNGSTEAPTVATRPTGLVAMAAGDTRIDLSWNAPADNGGRAITGYRIERSTDGGLTYPATPLVANHDAKQDGAIVRAYRDTDVMPATTRHYRVSAINMIGTGPVSDAEHATTSNCAPGAPTGLGLTAVAAALGATSTQIDLSWTAPTDLGTPPSTIRGYRIERSADGNALWTVLVADTEDTATSHSDLNLRSETTRHYRVSAMVSGCDSAGPPSDAESATSDDIVAPAPVSASVPAAGTSLTIVFGEDLDGTTAGAPVKEQFEVTAADGAQIEVASVTVSGANVTLTLESGAPAIKTGQTVTVAYTDLTPNDDAGGVVQDDDGNDAADFTLGPASTPGESGKVTNGSTVAATAPGAPSGLAAGGTGSGIRLTWTKPEDTGGRAVTGYLIEVSENGVNGPFAELVANHNTPGTDGAIKTEYMHGVAHGTTRHYRVKAINAVDTGPASNVAGATSVPEGAPPPVPTLTATARDAAQGATATAIDLAWTKPATEGQTPIVSYRIEVSEDGGRTFTALVANHDTMENGAIVTAYPHTGLGSEVTRHYRVSATNTQGTGPPSNVAHATTDDIVAPAPVSASVPAAGTSLTIVFGEDLDGTTAGAPAKEQFEVTAADGAQIEVASVTVSGANVTLALESGAPAIKTGQTVTVAYTDPSANDDAAAVQDDSGNDAASFATLAVTNNSGVAATAPGAPTELTAGGTGSGIRLTWTKPADTGGRAVTGYLIEVSEDGATGPFAELVANHNALGTDGAIKTEYMHDLPHDATRHYRIRARNAAGLGAFSNVDGASAEHPGAPDAPPQLTATANDAMPGDASTRIDLAWAKPAYEGDSAITGYRIEVSEDVDPLVWRELAANHAVMENGAIVTAYADTGLGSEETRHYRVFAMNGEGRSLASDAAHATTGDIESPEPVSASVAATGDSLTIVFDEALEAAARAPAAGRFRMTAADGARFRIAGVSVNGTDVTLDLHAESPVIRADQAVAVAYTDLTANDDAGGVVQDDSGNDAADFTLGPGLSVTVTNGSAVAAGAPGAPRNLGAASGGTDRIVVRWDAPADTGGRAITGYLIEVSPDGTDGSFTTLVADHTTMSGGRFEYVHMNRGPSDVRHYRVAARNALGLGPFAGPVEGSVELKGRVALTADSTSVAEGGSVAWTVTATTDEDARPEDGLRMQVRVVSEDATAEDDSREDSRGDYAAVDETVTFEPGDFDPQTVDGEPRYVAVKTGTVAIVDDVEVEDEERFSLSMSITGGGTGWARGADRVEVAIPDTDAWRLVVIADPASVVEGETHEVVLTARVVPGDPGDGSVPPTAEEDCVVRFPVSVRLETGGTATAGTDYTLDGALDARPIAACGAQTSWRVSLAAVVDAAHDPGETVTFAPRFAATPAVAPASLAPAEVTVREEPGVVLGALALTVEEGGEESYTAVLTTRPAGTVWLTASVSGDRDVTVEPAAPKRLTFTPESWNEPQTLTVRAAQDGDDEDDAATISHAVSGADYAGVTAADVPVAVLDDDKSFGVMTVRLSDGAAGAGTHDPAPAAHHGEPFHITLWWSELRTRHYETPRNAIGADRAIRVTGAAVVPVRDEHTGSWTQSRLRLKLTPEGTGDVTLVLEPMDCSYPDLNRPRPDPRALCAWLAQGQGITGLAERVRWTVRGIGAVPAAPRNLTLGTDEILTVQGQVVESRTVLVAGFDADPDASHWRVEAQAPGGDWSGARVWRGAKHGSRHNVRLDGLAPDGDWAVRARWENRYGPGPWAQARTTDGRAPEAPQGLAVAQGPDGRSVALTWTPSSAVARYQYRLGRLAQTMTGGWIDIPDSGPGAANRASFTVDGVERVWEIKAQLRAVSASGQAGAASAEARVPAAAPLVLADGVAVTSDPGEDGLYGIGDRIEVAVTMSRPVRREGAAPVVRLAFDDGQTREAALVRIRQPDTVGIGDPGVGSGDTLVFAYAVREGDEDTDGIAIRADGLELNGGRLVDASPGGGGAAAAVGLGRERHFPAQRVQAVLPEVERIERLGNRVWVHYERDLQPWTLDPVLRSGALGGQFHPDYSLSRPVSHAVIDARIVRGRGWSRSCGRTETGCRTVRLTLGKVYRDEAGGPGREGGYEAPDPGETVEISYAPNPHHAKYRLRDAAGNEAPAFAPMVAQHLAPGTAPVLAVDDGAGREGVAPVRFTVRLAPAATERVTVQYMTADMPAAVRAPAGRASAGDDYEATSGTLVFAPGETVKTIEVTVLEDTDEDSGEVFRLLLANPSGAVLGDAEATGTIRNDELLTATFGAVPESHDGETAFTLGLAFSEEVAVSAQMLRDAALRVTGGSVTGVRQVDAASSRRWEVTVAPSSDAAVTVALAPRASCDAPGAVCTGDGLGLDRAAEAAVPGPAALGGAGGGGRGAGGLDARGVGRRDAGRR